MTGREKEPYSIVFQQCEVGSTIAERFFVPGFKGYLPFLISGDDLNRIETRQEVELSEQQLLFGILMAMYEVEQSPDHFWVSKANNPTWLYLIDVLGKGFRHESLEAVFLNSASYLCNRNGFEPMKRVLEVGLTLIPDSSKIKSDLLVGLWNEYENYPLGGLDHKKITELMENLNPTGIKPEALEAVAYIGFASLLMRGLDDRIEPYLVRWVYPHVKHSVFKNKIKYLLEAEERTEEMYFVEM